MTNAQYVIILTNYWNKGYYTAANGIMKIFVAKNKITTDQYKTITGLDYVAA
jgi:uncharacterized XkdX family phage protein